MNGLMFRNCLPKRSPWRTFHSSSRIQDSPIRNVLLVQKPQDARVSNQLHRVVSHVREVYPSVKLFHEPPSREHLEVPPHTTPYHFRGPIAEKPPIDLVITLGGDGTILHASSMFSNGPVPPVLSFSLGTLGFLLPFHIEALETALADVFRGQVTLLPRMRLSCTMRTIDGAEKPRANSVGAEVMNEVSLHRGRSPHLTSVDAFVDGQHLTAAISDGLIIASPTGSTAYSLSSGGPIVHPSVEAILLTPVSPMSLSFRPLILPGKSKIRLQLNPSSRSSAFISMDGREAGQLLPGESVEVAASPHPIPCINRSVDTETGCHGGGSGVGDNWVRDINTLLGFNSSFKANRSTL